MLLVFQAKGYKIIMTSILAIETSTEACSVALHCISGTISRYAEEPRSHTQLLMPMIESVLSEAGIKPAELDAIGVAIGPGSFTGLRIGFAATQGLAFGLDIPVIPVSSLEVMVATFMRKNAKSPSPSKHNPPLRIMSILDARMGEFNCGCYAIDDQSVIAGEFNDRLLTAADAQQWVKELSPNVIVGDGKALLSSDSGWQGMLSSIYPDAIDLLGMAITRYDSGQAVPISSVDLVYLRGADAWQKRKRIRDA